MKNAVALSFHAIEEVTFSENVVCEKGVGGRGGAGVL